MLPDMLLKNIGRGKETKTMGGRGSAAIRSSSGLGSEWLDFEGSFNQDFFVNEYLKAESKDNLTRARSLEFIQMLKDNGVVDKNADMNEVRRYLLFYQDYDVSEYSNAPFGKLVEGFVKFNTGANERGYGDNKNALDTKYGLSKYIDSHKGMQLNTDVPMYRGVSTSQREIDQLQKAFASKKPIDMGGISSWSASKYMADRFTVGTLNATGNIPLVYKDVTKGQRNAMPWPHGGQKEAVYSKSAQFDVVSIKKDGKGYIVEVKRRKK